MRLNTPVTSQEFILDDGKTIVSTTDLKGKITYANPYFIEVSGFTEDELIGAPQKILRHPDMPVEAFADLWSTIKAGMPWSGMVKNRCKNGDFYWVYANVTPVIDRDYFWAIYFRTPGGVLFEVATNEPGFDRDEDTANLGQALKLPGQHEHLRSVLERTLQPLEA